MDTLANVSVLGGVYNTGSSCLHLAAQHGHLPMIERLLAAGANPKVADYRFVSLTLHPSPLSFSRILSCTALLNNCKSQI